MVVVRKKNLPISENDNKALKIYLDFGGKKDFNVVSMGNGAVYTAETETKEYNLRFKLENTEDGLIASVTVRGKDEPSELYFRVSGSHAKGYTFNVPEKDADIEKNAQEMMGEETYEIIEVEPLGPLGDMEGDMEEKPAFMTIH